MKSAICIDRLFREFQSNSRLLETTLVLARTAACQSQPTFVSPGEANHHTQTILVYPCQVAHHSQMKLVHAREAAHQPQTTVFHHREATWQGKNMPVSPRLAARQDKATPVLPCRERFPMKMTRISGFWPILRLCAPRFFTINTGLQPGEIRRREPKPFQRFVSRSGRGGVKTVETVFLRLALAVTRLKPGVNETLAFALFAFSRGNSPSINSQPSTNHYGLQPTPCR
jgi:hypothetical protein